MLLEQQEKAPERTGVKGRVAEVENNVKIWLDAEMQDFEEDFKEFNSGTMKKVPLWMFLCVAGMTALGFLVGAEWTYVLRVHLPIGAGFALIIWLSFWLQSRSVSMKKVRDSYEKALGTLSPQDQEGFARQASQCGKVGFSNRLTDKYPARLTVGPEYWLYFRDLGCQVFRVSDMERLYAREEYTKTHYNVGNTHVRQNLGIGMSLVVEYRDSTEFAAKNSGSSIYLENSKQLEEAYDLICSCCPKAQALFGNNDR